MIDFFDFVKDLVGLITDLQDDRATIPAAALSRVRVFRFVCLHFDHHSFALLVSATYFSDHLINWQASFAGLLSSLLSVTPLTLFFPYVAVAYKT